MAGGGKPASYLVLLFVTILFISLASFIFISTTWHGGDNKPAITARTYGELVNYVRTLEVAVLQKQKQLASAAGINTEHPPESVHEVAGHAPPKFNSEETGNGRTVPVPKTASTPFSSTLDESITKQWLSQLSAKLLCLRLKSGGIYLYHTRKAAGTSIRDILAYMAAEWHVPYYETEGIVLDRKMLDKSGFLSVTSLRDPVARVMSLYWYEHVGWYDGVLKQTERCKSLKEWVAAWRDGSRWKTDFMAKNPDSVYVEIENYYVKMLSGWRGGSAARKVTAQDLEVAKEVLRSFDLVLLSDWMGDATQIEAMNAIFPGKYAYVVQSSFFSRYCNRTRKYNAQGIWYTVVWHERYVLSVYSSIS